LCLGGSVSCSCLCQNCCAIPLQIARPGGILEFDPISLPELGALMLKLPLQQQRKWFGIGLAALALLGVAWPFSPGLPVMFGPSASAKTKQAGYELFAHEWQPNDPLAHGDGVGPVFNANSCVTCHFQGGAGGGGGMAQNVLNYDVLPTNQDPTFRQ